jgi:hypothetical protein
MKGTDEKFYVPFRLTVLFLGEAKIHYFYQLKQEKGRNV